MARQTSKIPLLTKKTHKNPGISKMNHMQKKKYIQRPLI
jgi:hypothetical protein